MGPTQALTHAKSYFSHHSQENKWAFTDIPKQSFTLGQKQCFINNKFKLIRLKRHLHT